MFWAACHALTREGPQLGLEEDYWITWKGRRGRKLCDAVSDLQKELESADVHPDFLIVHLGCNDLIQSSAKALHIMVRDLLSICSDLLPHTQLIWSYIFPRLDYRGATFPEGMNNKLKQVNRNARNLFRRANGKVIGHPEISPLSSQLFRRDGLHLTDLGLDIVINNIKGALQYFQLYPYTIMFPHWMMQ